MPGDPTQTQERSLSKIQEESLLEEFEKNDPRKKRNNFRPNSMIDPKREDEINEFIRERRTFRQHVPVWRFFEYWKLRADYYPYIKQSDAMDTFFLRGITCHPRLSDYPMCKDVIRDYFVCRDESGLFSLFNTCAPLKEQLSSCINVVFVRNHERGDKKFNSIREQKMETQREKKLERMLDNADSSIRARKGFQD